MMMIYNRYTLLIGSLDIMCDLSQDIICIYREREGEWVSVCVYVCSSRGSLLVNRKDH